MTILLTSAIWFVLIWTIVPEIVTKRIILLRSVFSLSGDRSDFFRGKIEKGGFAACYSSPTFTLNPSCIFDLLHADAYHTSCSLVP